MITAAKDHVTPSSGARAHKRLCSTHTLDNALIAVRTIKVQGMHGAWQHVRLPVRRPFL